MLPVLAAGLLLAGGITSLVKYRGENIFRTPEASQIGPAADNQHDISVWLKNHIENPNYADQLLRLVSTYMGDQISLAGTKATPTGRLIEDKNENSYYEIVVSKSVRSVKSLLSSESTPVDVLRIPVHVDEVGMATVCYEPGDQLFSYKVKDYTDNNLRNLYLDKIYE